MLTVGVDIGTTGCKAVVFDQNWKVKSSSYREYDLIAVGNKCFDLDPETVWDNMRKVIFDVNENTHGEIGAMAISAIGDVIIPVGENGCSIRPSILDFDPRGIEEIAAFAEEFGYQRIFEISGMPPLYINSLSKILWIKKYEKETYDRVVKWSTYEDYMLRKLGLESVVSYSLAARTMLFDITKLTWSDQILKSAGIKREMLPSPVPSGKIIAELDGSTAKELGFKKTPIVCSGGHDMVCAAVGAGLDPAEPHTAVDITGTIEGIVTVLPNKNTKVEMLENMYPCYPGYDGYVSFSVNLTSGCVLKWFRDELANDITEEVAMSGKDIYDVLLQNVNAGCVNDLFFLPYFAGSGNPAFNPDLQGAMYGLTLDTNRWNIVQGIIEGLCFELRSHLEGFAKAGIELASLRAVGGGAKSSSWLQMKANITGKEIVATGVPESSALGAAAFAATASGATEKPSDACRQASIDEKRYTPQLCNKDLIDKKYKKYQAFKAMVTAFEGM